MVGAAMPPQRRLNPVKQLASEVKKIIPPWQPLPRQLHFAGKTILTADLTQDQEDFQNQVELLQSVGTPNILLTLALESDQAEAEVVEVPLNLHVEDGDLNHAVARGRDFALTWPRRVRQVHAEDARTAFFDRLAEAIAIRLIAANSHPSSPPSDYHVDVTSNRSGDEILYANGHFYSTRTHLGYSACSGWLAANRYSFGIHYQGVPKFHPVLVTVPLQNSPHHVPLP